MSTTNPLADSRVLLIGGAGLIGSHIADALVAEPVKSVVIFDNFTRGTRQNLAGALQDPRFEIFDLGGDILRADLLDEAVSQADYVVHTAALWLLHCHEYPELAFEVNIRGTFNVLQACVKHNVRKLVYSSSASVYGDAVAEPMTESHPFNNETFYGATKIAGEQMMKAHHHRYGLNAVGLRYMNVYGARQDYRGAYVAVMMKMLDALDRGEAVRVFGDGKQAYDFIDVRDVAAANVAAMKSTVPFGFYNVGTGRKTSIAELAELLIELSGAQAEVRFDPDGTTFVTNRVGSTEAAQSDLDFVARITLEEGMRELVRWRKSDLSAN